MSWGRGTWYSSLCGDESVFCDDGVLCYVGVIMRAFHVCFDVLIVTSPVLVPYAQIYKVY